MDYYANIDEVHPNEQNRDGCRPGKRNTDRGMKAEDRSGHKLSAPCVYSLLGLSVVLSAAALCVAVILFTGNISSLSSSVAGLQVEVSHLKKLLSCPHGWVNFKQSCYLFSSSSQTWEEAQKSCMPADAHLVVINNAEEQDFLKKKDGVRRWIGLTDKASEDDWRWVDGTDYKSSAKFWNKGEPNNRNDEDCVAIYMDENWNDLSCNTTLRWICEKPAQ